MNAKSWRNNLTVTLTILCAVVLLVSCAPPQEPTAVVVTQEVVVTEIVEVEGEQVVVTQIVEVTPEPEEKEPVTIKWMMRWDNTRVEQVAKPVIEVFEHVYPWITVEFENIGSGDEYYQKLQTMMAADEMPDVFYPATYKAYAYGSKGAILPIDDLMARDDIDTSAFDQQILDLYKVEGKQMCMPLDTAALAVFYNKDLFDAAGVAYPEAGWTWDEFLVTAQALTLDTDGDGVTDQFGVDDDLKNYWPLMVWANTGHNIFDDARNPTEFLLTDQDSVASIQFVADLMVDSNVMPMSDQVADIGDMFAAGKAAMQVVGHWRVPRYTNETDFNWDIAPLPLGKTGVPVNRADGSCFAIAADSEHVEEAWLFVKYLSGPGSLGVEKLLDLQQMVPAIVEWQSDPLFLASHPMGVDKEAFLQGGELYGMYDPIHPSYDEWKSIWSQELGEVWLGNTTAQEAMDLMVPQVENMLENLADYE